ncbi:hypothetical protein [Mesorhizobium delmotii]|nr:hypothetical protein [Mesorhizobium delmotii]
MAFEEAGVFNECSLMNGEWLEWVGERNGRFRDEVTDKRPFS